jgi:hypothetical protein
MIPPLSLCPTTSGLLSVLSSLSSNKSRNRRWSQKSRPLVPWGGSAALALLRKSSGQTLAGWSKLRQNPTKTLFGAELGRSVFIGVLIVLQSVDEVVDDLHGWLKASVEKAPFTLVTLMTALWAKDA